MHLCSLLKLSFNANVLSFLRDDFKDYCEVCFKEFGDRVKHWVTVNEAWTFSSLGYGVGLHAPGRCSDDLGCTSGDSMTEPYIVSHNLILAHATVFRLYEEKFKVHCTEYTSSLYQT